MFVRNSADLRLKSRFTNHFGRSRSCELCPFRFPMNNASPTESTCQKSQLRIPRFTLRIKRLEGKFCLFRLERPESRVGVVTCKMRRRQHAVHTAMVDDRSAADAAIHRRVDSSVTTFATSGHQQRRQLEKLPRKALSYGRGRRHIAAKCRCRKKETCSERLRQDLGELPTAL